MIKSEGSVLRFEVSTLLKETPESWLVAFAI